MSMIRTSLTSGGTRLVADDVRDGERLIARQHPDVDPAVRSEFRVARSLDCLPETGRDLSEVEIHPRGQRFHVPAGDQGTEVPENHAAEHVQCGVGAHQRGAAFVFDGAADRGAGRRQRVVLGGDQVKVVTLAGAHDPGLHATPEQHPVVGWLATAARIEGRGVQHDPVRAGREHDRIPLAERLVVEFEPVGAHGRAGVTRGRRGRNCCFRRCRRTP
jgi:hypothetical protein